MTHYYPRIASADLLNVDPKWFYVHVHPEINDKFVRVGEWMYSVTELLQWKHDRDLRRAKALDELAALSLNRWQRDRGVLATEQVLNELTGL